MIDITYFQKIQNAYGTSDIRDAEKYEIKTMMNDDFNKPLNAHSVTINDETKDLLIMESSKLQEKRIKSRPDETFYIGDVVYWKDIHWLVTEVDADDTLVTTGKMEPCNWELKWQNSKGEILSRWAVISSASKYNDGENINAKTTLGSDQLMVQIKLDEESIKIPRKTKFLIDYDMENPKAYELTGTNNVVGSRGGHLISNWIVKECAYTATKDDLKYGVCNYFEPSESDTTDEPTSEIKLSFKGTNAIRIGGSKKRVEAQLYNADGETVNDATYSWTVTSDYEDYIKYSFDGNVLLIWATDDLTVNTTATVKVTSNGYEAKHIFNVEMGV